MPTNQKLTHESTGVVIANGFRVSEGFQQRIRLVDAIFHVLEAEEGEKDS